MHVPTNVFILGVFIRGGEAEKQEVPYRFSAISRFQRNPVGRVRVIGFEVAWGLHGGLLILDTPHVGAESLRWPDKSKLGVV